MFAPTLLGYLAAMTERVELGPGILSIYSRTPALVAQTAAGLDYVSGGRALLGLGTSGPRVIDADTLAAYLSTPRKSTIGSGDPNTYPERRGHSCRASSIRSAAVISILTPV